MTYTLLKSKSPQRSEILSLLDSTTILHIEMKCMDTPQSLQCARSTFKASLQHAPVLAPCLRQVAPPLLPQAPCPLAHPPQRPALCQLRLSTCVHAVLQKNRHALKSLRSSGPCMCQLCLHSFAHHLLQKVWHAICSQPTTPPRHSVTTTHSIALLQPGY